MDRVRVVAGDTLTHPWGGGTIASRTAVVVGNAVDAAAREVRDQAARIAGDRLEVAVADLVFADGRVFVAGSPDRGFELGAAGGLRPRPGSAAPSAPTRSASRPSVASPPTPSHSPAACTSRWWSSIR